MTWTKPDFEEISLSMEVTAYANTDDAVAAAPRDRSTDSLESREVLSRPA